MPASSLRTSSGPGSGSVVFETGAIAAWLDFAPTRGVIAAFFTALSPQTGQAISPRACWSAKPSQLANQRPKEHTSEFQSLLRNSFVVCLWQKKQKTYHISDRPYSHELY